MTGIPDLGGTGWLGPVVVESEIARYVFEGPDRGFAGRLNPGGLLIAGRVW